jgi:hypothetical protein
LYGTSHWRPLVNGIPTLFPASYITLLEAMETFPDELQGIPWEGLPATLEQATGISLISRSGSILVYDFPAGA